jgi:hypothetical protein
MVKAYFDSLLEEATIMAAVNNGFGHNGSSNTNGMIDTPVDGKEEPFDSCTRVTLPLHLEANGSNLWRERHGKAGNLPQCGRHDQPQSRPTRESVLKRLYDALMRRSLVKVRHGSCLLAAISPLVSAVMRILISNHQ